jgi:hypothetical protein
MSLRQLPAPARSSAAPGAPTASTAEAAWQALCTHPADAPLLHVDHGHRFHTPADTDGFFTKKKVEAPVPPALTPNEVAFFAVLMDFVRFPNDYEERMEAGIIEMLAYRPYKPLFKETLRRELNLKDHGTVNYTKSQVKLFMRMEAMLSDENGV